MSRIEDGDLRTKDEQIAALRAEVEALRRQLASHCQGPAQALAGGCCFREIFESSADCMFVKDRAGRYIVANEALARLFGRRAEEIAGLLDSDLFDETDTDRITAADREVLAGRTLVTEDPLHVEGQHRTFHVIKAPLRDAAGAIVGLYGIARDITDRRWAEQALLLTEERYRHLIGHMPIGVAVYEGVGDGEDFLIKEMNEAGMKLCRVTPRACIGKRLTDVFPGTRDSEFLRVYQRVWRQGRPESLPATYYAAGPLTGWFELHAFRLASGDLVSVFQDVSERIEREDSLRRVQSQVQALAANLPGIVHSYIRRADGRRELLYLSAGLEDLLGPDVTAWLRGRIDRYLTLIHPADWDRYQAVLEQSLEIGNHFECEYRVWTDGGYRWIQSLAQREIEPNGEHVWHGILLDIQDRKLGEEALRQSEQKLSHLFLSSPDSISVVREADGVILDVNPGFTRLTGYVREEVIGKTNRDLDTWVESMERERLLAELRRRGRVDGFIARVRRRDGGIFVGDVSVGRLEIEGEACFMLVTRDITPRIEAQEEIRRRAEMEAMLRRELSHRVQNNLMSLLGLVDMAASSAGSTEECAESIRSRVRAMATVHALLSRSDGASVALRELVQTLTPPGCRGAVEITGPDVRLDSDAGQKLGLVLNELMTNSWKYGALGAEKGVVRIGWRCEERHAGETQILLVWQETGGPTIEREPDVGAGLGLISGLAQSDLRGSVDLRFPPQGAQHTIRVRLTPPRGGDLDADRHAGDS